VAQCQEIPARSHCGGAPHSGWGEPCPYGHDDLLRVVAANDQLRDLWAADDGVRGSVPRHNLHLRLLGVHVDALFGVADEQA
jgi:hypothetical protein